MCPCRLHGFVPTLLIVALIGCGDELSTEVDVPLKGPTTPQGPQATPPNAAPRAVAGPDQTAECATHAGSSVTLTSAGSGDSDGQIRLYEWFENGELIATGPTPTITLAYGTHTIILRTTDDDGGTNDDVVVVTIRDSTAPTLAMVVTPTTLWPPNHTMHVVARGTTASDACDPAPSVVFNITSDEPVSGLGDGDTSPDWLVQQAGVSTYDVSVRAERSGLGDGRVYTIGAVATDRAGNSSAARSATVTVPHNQ